MLFNSFEFVVFFVIVLILYYLLTHHWQNRMLLFASYFFYGWWDWRFLSLILISTIVDFYCGAQIYNQTSQKKKKYFLRISIIANLSLLGIFKYWNFFTENVVSLFLHLGIRPNIPLLQVLVPVGISFYTFQTMTYSINIYRDELIPTSDFFDFALYVSFFPQLVAGPIERAQNLLPQIENRREYNNHQFTDGLQLIGLGLFKKVVVADNLGIIVDQIYGNPKATGMEYVIATLAFAFQIYGDFSGYTDVARGSAKCLGFELMENFNRPYLAVNPSDFWKRWHISLSTWVKDYIYIPLGGSRKGIWRTYWNLILSMLLCGLWHGAAWNFVLWGVYHGILLCIYRIYKHHKTPIQPETSSAWMKILNIGIMFNLTCLGWIFFRAKDFDQIKLILQRIFTIPWYSADHLGILLKVLFFSLLPLLLFSFQSKKNYNFSFLNKSPHSKPFFFSMYSLIIKSIGYGVFTYLFCFYGAKAQTFIYFQF